MKVCSKCKTEQPRENYNKYNKSKDGLQSRCKECSRAAGKEHYHANKEKYVANQMAWRKKDNNKKHNQACNRWRKKHPEATNAMQRKRNRKLRQKALEKIGSLVCCRCRCDRYEFLEINHINGGGNKERKQTTTFYLDIIHERRGISDLEILCRPCNHIHYLELRYGKLPFKVIWNEQSLII